MAEEKLNTGQGEQITMDEAVSPAEPSPDKEALTTPEQDGPAQPETGDVALNNEAEAAVPGEGAKEPETPTLGTDEKAPEAITPEDAPRQMKDQIMALLDQWKERQPQEKCSAPKSTEKDH